MNAVLAARVSATLFAVVALFQIALIVGAPWGSLTQGGSHPGSLPTSGRIIAAVSAVLLILMALVVLARVGQGPFANLPGTTVNIGLWITLTYAGLGVLMNLASRSAAERLLWAPFTAVLFACLIVAAVGTRVPALRHD